MEKILIIRFSSIGDIVLTTPVIRCLRNKFPKAEIHFLTKKSFEKVILSNPYVDKVWSIEKEIHEISDALKKEGFTKVIDLHKNLRSKRIKRLLKVPYLTFDKLNIQKWLLTQFKINQLPQKHIVDRYFEGVSKLDIQNDQKGLNFFISKNNVVRSFPENFKTYVALVVGAAHATKALSIQKAIEIIEACPLPVILIGGPTDKTKSEEIVKGTQKLIWNTCGEMNLEQSASLLQQAEYVITPDTGMMHIAAALQKRIVSVWGNTVPEFGMYPYIPQQPELVKIVEVNNLSCRPCSKIGFEKCPKKHFNCIEQLPIDQIIQK